MDQDRIHELMARQAEVHEDWERLEEYGLAIPDVWREARYDGVDLVALLTDPDAHRDRLLAVVEHPDRLTVRATPYSRAHLAAIGEEVLTIVGREFDRWTSAGPSTETYAITLRSDESALAEELHRRFGGLLDIRLGSHPFPLTAAAPTRVHPAPTSSVELPNATLSIEFDQPSVKPGHTVVGRVRIRNTSTTARLRFDSGSPAIGITLHPDGNRAGGFNGAIGGVGRVIDLAPGADTTIGFVAGTDAIDATHGAALPAGTYLIVVPIDVDDPDRHGVIVTPPAALVIVD